MEKPVIHLTIGSLVNQYIVVNLSSDGNNHSDEPHKYSNLFDHQDLESALSGIIHALNNALEKLDEDSTGKAPEKVSH